MSSELFAFGLSAFQRRDFLEAERLFTDALIIEPNNPNYLFYRASARAEQGNKNDAVADLSAAIAIVPTSLPILYRRGELYLEMNDLEKASADFSLVLEDTSDDGRYWRALAHLGRGMVFLETGDVEMAIIDLSDAEDLAKAEGDSGLIARIGSELERSGF